MKENAEALVLQQAAPPGREALEGNLVARHYQIRIGCWGGCGSACL